jgi:hypothetical protein
METHNGHQGYEFQPCDDGSWKLYRFDLSVNGAKLFVGTVPTSYPTSGQAIIAGNEWVEQCEGLDREQIVKLICNPSLIR